MYVTCRQKTIVEYGCVYAPLHMYDNVSLYADQRMNSLIKRHTCILCMFLNTAPVP